MSFQKIFDFLEIKEKNLIKPLFIISTKKPEPPTYPLRPWTA